MKRSSKIQLVMIASVSSIALMGCDDTPPTSAVEVTSEVFASRQECVAAGNTDTQCATAEQAALAAAPKFSSREQCETEFGPAACAPATGSSNNSVFVPMMVGYMLGNMNDGYDRGYSRPYYGRDYQRDYGRKPTYAPTYNSRSYSGVPSSNYRSPDGARIKPIAPPSTERGGFGSTARNQPGYKSQLKNSGSPQAYQQGARPSKPSGSAYRSTTGSYRGGFGSSARGHSAGG